jgi:hypothetical protein
VRVKPKCRESIGVGPSSVLEWDDGGVFVRRVGRFSSEDVQNVLFAKEGKRPAADVKDAIRKHVGKRHARD